MLDENIYPYYKCKNGINIKNKDQIIEFKNPINFCAAFCGKPNASSFIDFGAYLSFQS